MKIGLILPGSLWFSPYVRIYTRILDEMRVDYAIISWNREGNDKKEGFQYNTPSAKGHGSASWKEYRGYIRFVKNTIKEQGFDRVIVFGPQTTCMLSIYLLLYFRGRYMIDYRDLSIEQKLGFKQLFAIMLNYSWANVISSPGFKCCLPKRKYLLSHNFDVEMVRQALSKNDEDGFNTNKGIDVLTIGGIRDYSSNIEVVKAMANKEGYSCRFVGKGGASKQIEQYCVEQGVENVYFHGFYNKEEEPSFIKDTTFLNIFYPRVITHDTAMSNRFYNSLIFKRPMIVTKNTTQGDFAEQYGLGVALEDCDGLAEKLVAFTKTDFKEYANRCNNLLNIFLEDVKLFEEAVVAFVTDKGFY